MKKLAVKTFKRLYPLKVANQEEASYENQDSIEGEAIHDSAAQVISPDPMLKRYEDEDKNKRVKLCQPYNVDLMKEMKLNEATRK